MCRLPSTLRNASSGGAIRLSSTPRNAFALRRDSGRGPEGLIPWDGTTVGELEMRGPSVAGAYYRPTEPINTFTPDGWFRTGDIVTVDANGRILLQDRAKDLIKSGGESITPWLSRTPLWAIRLSPLAAVVGRGHPKWQERPLAVVVLKPACNCHAGHELRAFLEPHFARWWLPDAYVFAEEIPLTGSASFEKGAARTLLQLLSGGMRRGITPEGMSTAPLGSCLDASGSALSWPRPKERRHFGPDGYLSRQGQEFFGVQAGRVRDQAPQFAAPKEGYTGTKEHRSCGCRHTRRFLLWQPLGEQWGPTRLLEQR